MKFLSSSFFMHKFNSHYAQWRHNCSQRFHAMSDSDLLLELANYAHDENEQDNIGNYWSQNEYCGWMYGFGHLIAEMRARSWDISALSTGWPDYQALPCILKNMVLLPVEDDIPPEGIKKHILEQCKSEKKIIPPQKKGVIHWLKTHLKKNQITKKKITPPLTTPSFSFLCTPHGKVARYEKIRKYDIYIINHTDMTYPHLLLWNDMCYGEDDIYLWTIAPNSIHHIWTSTRENLRYPSFLDVYEYRGALPTTFLAEIPEKALYTRNRKFIKYLNQEWWAIDIQRME